MDLFCTLIDRLVVDRTTQNNTIEAEPFPEVVYVTSASSFVGTLLLRKKIMFLLKLPKLPSALKLLLFTT